MNENRWAEGEVRVFPWNQTQADYPAAKCVHHFFEEQVARTPEAVAVVFEERQLTYRELNERAEALAAELRHLGVGPDVCVGLFMRRSLEMVVGLYAIHKAGGAYLPMDPAYPAERLAFMLEDARVPVLLTHSAVVQSLPETTAAILCTDAPESSRTTHHAPRTTQHTVTSDHLAYLIYTSGSTGKPKGVMVRHRNVANFFTGMDQVLGRAPGVWLAVTSICFDISVLELFWTLARGFKVVLHGEESAAHARTLKPQNGADKGAGYSLAEQMVQHGVTHFQCTPSLAAMMLQDEKTLKAMRQIPHLLFGGEPLPPSLVEQLSGSAKIFNMYGPTETTVWSSVHPVSASGGKISLGKPIANTEIYLLDEQLQPVGPGVPGELFIGGAGVTRGYLNRPELTAERFLRDPFSREPEARLYRTGDLARFTPEGTLEFLGRVDQQVKLRGFRIELGEIETVLRQHPAIRECVLSVWEPRPGDKRLAAYFVAKVPAAPQPSELRAFLKARLPEYMVPSTFLRLESLPLTPNGKVDRKALPSPAAAAGVSPAVEPGVPPGGTSPRPVAPPESSAPAPAPITISLTEAQREIWYASQVSAASSCSFNQSVLFRLGGPLNVPELERCLQRVVARHEALRVTIAPAGDVQQIHSAMRVELPCTDLASFSGQAQQEQVQARLAEAVSRPFDLAKGPLFRFQLLRLAERQHILVLTFHHVICDGCSLGIVIQEVAQQYAAGTQFNAAPRPASFSEFVLEQQKGLQTPERAAAEQYWLEQYAAPPRPLALPTNRPRPARRTFAGGSTSLLLGPELSEELKRFSARQRCSLATTLLAGFYLLLHRLSSQPEVIIGLPMTSRWGEAGERLIGHCVNFLPLRLPFDLERSVIDHLEAVRSLLLEAHEHQNFTLGSLLEKLPRSTARLPLAPVMFNLDWAWDETQLAGLETQVEANPYCFCRFELSLCVAELQGRLELQCQFSTELFDLNTIQQWLKFYQTLLSAIVVEPEQPLREVLRLVPEQLLQATGAVAASPEPASASMPASAGLQAFSGPIEEKLAQIWREVIVVDQVGRTDNFFDLGGHSLLATQVISRITKAFNVEVPLRTIFETPTLEALAEAVVRAQAEQTSAPAAIVPLSRQSETRKLQERLSQISDEDLLKLLQDPDFKDLLP